MVFSLEEAEYTLQNDLEKIKVRIGNRIARVSNRRSVV